MAEITVSASPDKSAPQERPKIHRFATDPLPPTKAEFMKEKRIKLFRANSEPLILNKQGFAQHHLIPVMHRRQTTYDADIPPIEYLPDCLHPRFYGYGKDIQGPLMHFGAPLSEDRIRAVLAKFDYDIDKYQHKRCFNSTAKAILNQILVYNIRVASKNISISRERVRTGNRDDPEKRITEIFTFCNNRDVLRVWRIHDNNVNKYLKRFNDMLHVEGMEDVQLKWYIDDIHWDWKRLENKSFLGRLFRR